MTTTYERIKDFHSHFSGVIWEIDNIQETQTIDNMKITLYVVVLDALSSIVYPMEKKPRKRFAKFILKFGNCWTGKKNISLPILMELLDKYPDKNFTELRDFAHGKMCNWPTSQPVYLEKDLSLDEVQERWPRNENKELLKLGKKDYEYLQHFNLLYTYRNSLVHQFLRLGWIFDELEVDVIYEPYYRHALDTRHIQAPENHWYLCYPKEFLSNLCTQSLYELSEHFRRTQEDPFPRYNRSLFFFEE